MTGNHAFRPISPIRILRVLAVLAGLVLTACESLPLQNSPPPPASREIRIVEAYTGAFNTRNLEAMTVLMHRDIQWLSVNGSTIQTVSAGRKALRADMAAYFDTGTDVISSLSGTSRTGHFVSTVETARWTGPDGAEKAQSAIAVYEISESGLIRRVWYFPETTSAPEHLRKPLLL